MSDTIIYVLPHLGAISLLGLLRSAKIVSYLGVRVYYKHALHKTSLRRFYQHYFPTHLPISLVLE